jgi:hypothetical protein
MEVDHIDMKMVPAATLSMPVEPRGNLFIRVATRQCYDKNIVC